MAGLTYEEAKRKAEEQKYSATGNTEGIDEQYINSLMNDTPYYGDTAANPDGGIEGDEDGDGGGGKKKGRGGSNNLIDSIYKNSLTAQERQLKANLDQILDELEAQKVTTYANQIVANKNSNEAMLGQGINSGSIAQAALSSNNALQGNLGAIGEAETQAYKDYENDLASLQAQIESEKMSALLNDYYNQQQMDYQKSRDTVSDSQYADSLALQQQQYADSQAYQAKTDKEEWAYNMWQLLGYATQEIANTLGVAKGTPYPSASSSSGSSSGGSGGSGTTKPKLTLAQTLAEIEKGNLASSVLAAYEYYFDEPYSGGTGFSDSGNMNISQQYDYIDELLNKYNTVEEVIAAARQAGISDDIINVWLNIRGEASRGEETGYR